MKKRTIAIISVIAVLGVAFTIIGIYFNNVFFPDDYGKKYEEVWVSKDKNISFIRDNKKGFDGQNCLYRANYLNNNPDYSMYVCTVAFTPFFDVYINGWNVLSGESHYNPITHTMEVTIDTVNKDSPYEIPYKVGDVIEFKQSE